MVANLAVRWANILVAVFFFSNYSASFGF